MCVCNEGRMGPQENRKLSYRKGKKRKREANGTYVLKKVEGEIIWGEEAD